MDCPVCCEPIRRNPVVCASCNYETCTGCARRYLLSMLGDAACMSCKHTWDREFLDAALGSVFVNTEYKKHRETVLLDRERAMLPDTMTRLENYRFCTELNTLTSNKRKRVRELKLEIMRLRNEMNEDAQYASRLKRNNYQIVTDTRKKQKTEQAPKRRIIRGCPSDDCRGYLFDDFVCGACNKKVCDRCHEFLQDGHACKPENVSAAKLIVKDSKACPTCAALIFRISGCSQMWCTQCRTAFNWNTGEVETGIVHNPHYYEWQRRRTGRNEDRAAAVRVRDCFDWAGIRRQLSQWRVKNLSAFERIHRRIVHIQHVVIHNLNVRYNRADYNLGLRLQYLNNELSETDFKIKLQRREKRRDKDTAIRLVLEMYVAASRDIFLSMQEAQHERSMEELRQVEAYANEELEKIGKRFNMNVGDLYKLQHSADNRL